MSGLEQQFVQEVFASNWIASVGPQVGERGRSQVDFSRRYTRTAYADQNDKERNLRASASPKPDGLQHMAQVGAPDLGRFVWPGGVGQSIM